MLTYKKHHTAHKQAEYKVTHLLLLTASLRECGVSERSIVLM